MRLGQIAGVALLLIGIFIPTLGFASMMEPLNLDTLKKELVKYHDSQQYNRDLSDAIHDALYYLQFRITQNQRLKRPKKLAMVLNIDETALSNYPAMKRFNFGGTPKEVIAAEQLGNDPAIPFTLALYDYAKSHGVAVFFITGRNEAQRSSTIKNLIVAGYQNWNKLYMKPKKYHHRSLVHYKTEMRKKIDHMGFDIVLNIGDQFSDLKGGHADMDVKLANPYYSIS